jgi:hypothetical protein
VQIVLDHIGTWLVATAVALLTIFSDRLLARIRFQLNRADLRVKQYEELAQDLSTYTFWVEVYQERYARGWTDDPDDLTAVADKMNEAMVALRTKQYVYWSWVKTYWGEMAVQDFTKVIEIIRKVDLRTHDFNDPQDWDKTAAKLAAELSDLRLVIDRFLTTGLQGD